MNTIWLNYIFIGSLKQSEDFIRMKLFMQMIRYSFGCITHSLPHFRWKIQTILGFQDIAYAAFSGLAVNTDNICIIITSHICRINRQIRHCPMVRIFFLDPVHSFCNGILMGSGECSKYKCSAVWASFIDVHSCTCLIDLAYVRHVREIKPRIHTLGIHIHCQCNNVHVTGTLSISKKSTLDPVCPCQNTHLCICHTTASVIMRMKGYDHIISVFHMFTHILYLTCIYMRHCQFYCYRQIDNAFIIWCRLPYIQNCIADFKGIFRLCTGKAFRAVLKLEIAFCFISKFF